MIQIALRVLVITILSCPLVSLAESDQPTADELTHMVSAIERLDALRSGMAGTFEDQNQPADQSTFKQVCKPVGMQAKKLAEDNGWKVIQMAAKYRNPKHQLDADGQQAYDLLKQQPSLMGLWSRTEMDGQPGMRYFRRISVESPCLLCHGPKDDRPKFVNQNYPEDRAYDFQVGDLRGIYSVFAPDRR